jgi:transglutaminase-like putative cysteine protease
MIDLAEPVAEVLPIPRSAPPLPESYLDLLGGSLGRVEETGTVGDGGLAENPRENLPVAGSRSPRGEGGLRPYRDLERRYSGPSIDPVGDGALADRAILSYEPREESLLINALVVEGFNPSESTEDVPAARRPYRTSPCRQGCVELSLIAEATGGVLRLPVPTGHRLDASTVRVDGAVVEAWEGRFGEPQLFLEASEPVLVEYVTGPAASPATPSLALPELPVELARRAEELRGLDPVMRPLAAAEWVSGRVTYSRSPEAVRAFAEASARGLGFLASALEAGVGDCDVQNGVLATLLEASGMEARMVLGFVGHSGIVEPGLHAWVEVRGEDDVFRAVDASLGGNLHPLTSLRFDPAGTADGSFALPTLPGGLGPWLATLLLLAGSALWVARGSRPAPEAAGKEDLAALLAGALRHPGAFAAMPALEHGRYIPRLGGGALSLHRMRRLAAERRLFHSRGGWLAGQALRRRIVVIDNRKPEGAVVLRALGAIDLDRWQGLLDGALNTDSGDLVNRRLEELGAPWRVRENLEQERAVEEVDLGRLKLGPCWVMVNPTHPDLEKAWARLGEGEEALFNVLERVIPRLDIPETEGAELLARLAASALGERAARLGEARP